MSPARPRGRWVPRRPDREEQRRRQQHADREKLDDANYDPAAPTDEDWAVGDGPQMRRLTAPEPVGDALSAFLARTGWADRVRTTQLLEDWATIVGPDVAANSRPQRIERGALVLVVASSTWATQLTWLESTIIEKVNAAAGRTIVQRLRVVVGNLDDPPAPGS